MIPVWKKYFKGWRLELNSETGEHQYFIEKMINQGPKRSFVEWDVKVKLVMVSGKIEVMGIKSCSNLREAKDVVVTAVGLVGNKRITDLGHFKSLVHLKN